MRCTHEGGFKSSSKIIKKCMSSMLSDPLHQFYLGNNNDDSIQIVRLDDHVVKILEKTGCLKYKDNFNDISFDMFLEFPTLKFGEQKLLISDKKSREKLTEYITSRYINKMECIKTSKLDQIVVVGKLNSFGPLGECEIVELNNSKRKLKLIRKIVEINKLEKGFIKGLERAKVLRYRMRIMSCIEYKIDKKKELIHIFFRFVKFENYQDYIDGMKEKATHIDKLKFSRSIALAYEEFYIFSEKTERSETILEKKVCSPDMFIVVDNIPMLFAFTLKPIYKYSQYISPELFRTNIHNERSDIYAFGVMLWELWSGKKAFENEIRNDGKHIFKIIHNEKDPLREKITSKEINFFDHPCLSEVSELIQSCWEHNPKHRPECFKDVREDFGMIIKEAEKEQRKKTGSNRYYGFGSIFEESVFS